MSGACPHCGHTKNRVYNSRPASLGYRTWRRRLCASCGKRWSTVESPECEFPPPTERQIATCLGRWLHQHDICDMGVRAVKETA